MFCFPVQDLQWIEVDLRIDLLDLSLWTFECHDDCTDDLSWIVRFGPLSVTMIVRTI